MRMRKLRELQQKLRPKIIDKIFLGLFFLLLFIPMTKISHENVSKRENRVLAKFPVLFVENHFNEKFTSEFESWFNDRFNGRRKLIHYHTKLKEPLDNFSQNEWVYYGNEGWLFYKGNNSLDNFQNKTVFSEEELKIVSQYLSDIDNWARQNGKLFYFLIAPDKNKIYGEHITSLRKIRPNKESRANQFIKYLKENTSVKVVYPYQSLLNNKAKGLLYYKQDTHWNDFGSYIAYSELLNVIKKDHKNIKNIYPSKYKKVLHETGDLSKMINFAISKDQSKYLEPEMTNESLCKYQTEDEDPRKGFECKNKSKPLKVVVFRDSFADALTRYLNNTFSFVKYEWRWDITKTDLEYIKNNADIIILETVERSIPSLLSLKFPED